MVGFWDGVGRVGAQRGRWWDRVLTTASITATPRASLGHTKLNPPDTDAVGIRGVVPPSAHAERAPGSAQGPHTVLTQGRPMHGHPLHGHAPVLGFCENNALEVINREERGTGDTPAAFLFRNDINEMEWSESGQVEATRRWRPGHRMNEKVTVLMSPVATTAAREDARTATMSDVRAERTSALRVRSEARGQILKFVHLMLMKSHTERPQRTRRPRTSRSPRNMSKKRMAPSYIEFRARRARHRHPVIEFVQTFPLHCRFVRARGWRRGRTWRAGSKCSAPHESTSATTRRFAHATRAGRACAHTYVI